MGAVKQLSLGLSLLACFATSAHTATTLSTKDLWADDMPGIPEAVRVTPTTPSASNEPFLAPPVQPIAFQYVRLSPVLFEHDTATLTTEGQQSLEAAVEYINTNPTVHRLIMEGNTDEVGRSNYNFSLSERRLKSVRAYLSLKGVAPELVKATGLGETTPIDENWTRVGRSRNRQVAIYAVHLAR